MLLLSSGDADSVGNDLGGLLLGHLQHGSDGDLQLKSRDKETHYPCTALYKVFQMFERAL